MRFQIRTFAFIVIAGTGLACGAGASIPAMTPTFTAIPPTATPATAPDIATSAPTVPPATEASAPGACPDWETYTSPESGFSLSFPCEWDLSDGHNANSYAFHNSLDTSMEPPGLMWFWVSVLPQGATFENGSVYNFM